MNLFLVTDTHGSIPPLPSEMDAALVCGDFSDFGRRYEPLFDSLTERKVPIFFTSGNHESPALCKRIAEQYKAICLDYTWMKWRDILLVGISGYDIFDHKQRVRTIEAFSQELCALQIVPPPQYLILLSHEPLCPWQYKDKVYGNECLQSILKAWQFDLVVTGHFHEYIPRIETDAVLCPTINPSPDGCLLEVNPVMREFKLVTLFESEEQ